jgi:putative ABC transport system permease protein
VRALERKLLRDLRGMVGQGITIALVVGAGIAAWVGFSTTWSSLDSSRELYYTRYRFAEVFASLARAPESVRERIEALPGVAVADSRIVATARIPLEVGGQPPLAEVISLPRGGHPALNAVLLRAGRMIEPGRADEALLLEAFADRYGIIPGDTLPVVLAGALRQVRIVGIATSPEFIYPIPPGGSGLTPDDERFAVLWMEREAVAPALRMEGAFNSLLLRLQPGAQLDEVLDRVDRILRPYGGLRSIGRALQPSNFILEGELRQLRAFAIAVPLIFLGVAGFLLNVVLSRIVLLQRGQIAALKALGYPDRTIALHFLQMVVLIVLAGVLLGTLGGAWLGRAMTDLYGTVFGFPVLEYRLGPLPMVTGAAVALVAGVVGALGTLRGIMRLPPAEAMQPPAPVRYRPTFLEALGAGALLGPSGRMVLRELGRHPVRLLLSALGISLGVAIMVVGRFTFDAIDQLIDLQFQVAWREHVSVDFDRPLAERALRELAHLPGVYRVEGLRTTPVRFHAGHRVRDGLVQGYAPAGELRQLVQQDATVAPLPSGGIVLTSKLAEILHLGVGDSVLVEFREQDDLFRRIPVTGMADELFGLQGHMAAAELAALLGGAPTVTTALLRVDTQAMAPLLNRINALPRVAGVTRPEDAVRRFREQSAEWLLIMTAFLTAFAAVIAVGVVYNNARVALSMRSRDLASLRVLGFTRREISRILLGEMGVQLVLAIPPGCALGYLFARGVFSTLDPERYRFPTDISMQSYVVAALVVLLAGGASALLVRRRLDRLDLIAVLKTRE